MQTVNEALQLKSAYIDTKVVSQFDSPVAPQTIVHVPARIYPNRSSVILPRQTTPHRVHNVESEYFDEATYIAKTQLQPGEDAYRRNKFNQAASDGLTSNRDIPDTRNRL